MPWPVTIVWDVKLKGFGVRVKPTGVKTYAIQHRNGEGLSRRLVIGKHGVLTSDQARKLALKQLGSVAAGQDPVLERKTARASLTVSQICEWYLTEARAGSLLGRNRRPLKESTLRNDEARIVQHIRPLLGGRSVRALTLADIEGMQASIASGKTAAARKRSGRGATAKGGEGVAARTTATLRAILGHAARWQIINANTARGVRLPASGKRVRRLSEAEIRRLGEALEAATGRTHQWRRWPFGLTSGAASRLAIAPGL